MVYFRVWCPSPLSIILLFYWMQEALEEEKLVFGLKICGWKWKISKTWLLIDGQATILVADVVTS